MTFKIFYKSNDGGGAGADKTPLNDGGGDAAGNDQGADKNAGATHDTPPDMSKWTIDDYKKHLNTLQADYGKKLSSATDEVSKLKKKLGQQSQIVGKFNTLAKMLESDPRKFVEHIAGQAGLKFSFGDEPKKVSFADALKDDKPEDLDAVLDAKLTEREKRIQQALLPQLKLLHEESLSRKFRDYDDLAEHRETVASLVKLGQLSSEELLHYAARGMNLDEAIKEAKAEAVKEYIDDLAKKSQGHVSDGSRSSSGDDNKGPKLEDVLLKLSQKF